jgi:hypothetical protein
VSEHHTMGRTEGLKGKLHASLTSALYGSKRSASRFGRFISGQRSHAIFLGGGGGGWKDRRAFVCGGKEGSQSEPRIAHRSSRYNLSDTFRKNY